MQILLVHADFIEFSAQRKALKSAEEIEEERKKGRAEEALVALIAVEKQDEGREESVAKKAKEEILEVYNQVKAQRVVLYPYAHLSSSLSSPQAALEIMKKTEELLKGAGYEVMRAPFGWYKSFTLSCKGHPLAELSRRITVEEEKEKITEAKEQKEKSGEKKGEVVSAALKAEQKLKSKRYVLNEKLELVPAESFDFSRYQSLKILYGYETAGTREIEKEPAHVKIMKELELVDNEPASDSGNLRWYPKGELIKRLLEMRATDLVLGYGAMQVETPIMYDFAHPHLSQYLHRFPARQYVVKSDEKELFLRFSACFGQYLMKHDMVISYRHMPIKLYELTHYSFRREQSGELTGLKRLRAFTMPDMHTLCIDTEQAKKEFVEQVKLGMEWMENVNLNYDFIIRCVKDFYEENKEFIKELASLIKKPVLIEIWEERFFYFVMKAEFSVNDTLNKASTLSTMQIDVENAERFDINYFDENGEKKHPLILHASVSGSIDRNLYAILEAQAMLAERGEKPMLPLWLCPTQVRIIPVSKEFLRRCEEVLKELESSGVRADIDDSDATLSKKIREAEKEWIPYIAVIGEKEVKSGKIALRIRKENKQKESDVNELIKEIKEACSNKPLLPLTLPKHLSRRPIFRG